MRTLAFLVVCFVAFSVWQTHRREQNEERLALVASALAGRDVGVGCPGFWTRLVEITPYSGWVEFDEHGRPGNETTLSAGTCRDLERLWRRDTAPTFECLELGPCDGGEIGMVDGLVTLAHESWHLRGLLHEAQTQCYAIQSAEQTARHFGLDEVTAQRVAAYAAARDAQRPLGTYRSADCRPGGAFDLRPNTPAWPG